MTKEDLYKNREHINSVNEWIFNTYKKQGRDLGKDFFVGTYRYMFKPVLSSEGVELCYEATMETIMEALSAK